jgi:hypothetical protein
MKQFTIKNRMHSKYDRLVWEEELDDRFDPTTREDVQALEIGDYCDTNDPFLFIERAIDG